MSKLTRAKLIVSLITGISACIGSANAAAIHGKVIPTNANALIRAISPEKSYETRSQADGTFRIDHLPASTYNLQIQANGYATDWSVQSVQLSKNQISKDFKIILQKPGSISGLLSPVPENGIVLAKNRKTRFAEGVPINKDGTYKIAELAPGIYDLILIPYRYQRVIGVGPLPSPNTLTSDDKQKIMDTFSKTDDAMAKKDINAMLACFISKYKYDNCDLKGLKYYFQNRFKTLVDYSIIRQIDVIAGISGKKAVVINRVIDKSTFKPGFEMDKWDRKRDVWVELICESGKWKISRLDSADYKASFRHASDLPIAYPMKGEPEDIILRYSGDPTISNITVKSGADSNGHNYTLIPLK